MNIRRFIPAILWLALSVILLCLPGSTIPRYPWPWLATVQADKWIHAGLFGMLCLLFSLPIRSSEQNIQQKKKWLWWITLCGILYGILMEFVQKNWVLNRSFEFWDILADITGCLAAYFISTRGLLKKG